MREDTRGELWEEVRTLREENEMLWERVKDVSAVLEQIVIDAQEAIEMIKMKEM